MFCGSKPGDAPGFAECAAKIGRLCAEAGVGIVYGGGRVGLMGIVADAALAAGGEVIGVIPKALADLEVGHDGLTELRLVASMHERKAEMATLAGGFVALPGGAGTLEEIVEQWTWAQLGIHAKPCILVNHEGYYDPLRSMVETMASRRFLSSEHAALFRFEPTPEMALARVRALASMIDDGRAGWGGAARAPVVEP